MTMESLFTKISSPPGKKELAKIKLKAIRRGMWFKVLTRAERAQMELTIKIVKRIRSHFLARIVTSIVEKLLEAMESKVSRLMREVGHPLARNLSETAQKWGNKSAKHWSQDSDFVQFLTIMYLNKPLMA
ncbi:MAG: hypothetical protein JSV75_03505 [Candidatus Bathyarchaeota archaeon]|nr:MAG: hypothetical protein JSV75_03505 [Candidatus Bathyarchaeota archaeon]